MPGEMWTAVFRCLHYALLEIAAEDAGLMVLHLAILDRRGAQELIHLDGIDSSSSLFIQCRHGAYPVMNVIVCRFASFACLHMDERHSM